METVTYKGVPIRLSADFSNLAGQKGLERNNNKIKKKKNRRGWKEVFQVMKGKDLHPRLLCSAKLSFRMGGEIKCFSEKFKVKEFIITKPLLYEILGELI